MMKGRLETGQIVSGLRTRFQPKSRIGQGLVTIAPWIDVVLMIFFFMTIDSKFVMQPGMMVEIPRATFSSGSQSSEMVAVVRSIEGVNPGNPDEIVFFDNQRFIMRYKSSVASLRKCLEEQASTHPDSYLVILADKNVKHGTLVLFYDMAMKAGIKYVNLATRP